MEYVIEDKKPSYSGPSVNELIKNFDFLSRMDQKNQIIGREEEINLLEESFYKKRMKNTLLVGPAGCGKTTIVENIAYILKNKYVFLQFDVGGSVAGTKYRGEFEQRIHNVLKQIMKYNECHEKPIVLFIDEAHSLYKAGGAEGAIDASNILKPYLSKGDITLVGATTDYEYEHTIKKDLALSRRLSPIFIKPLEKEQVLNILKKFSEESVSDIGLEYIYNSSLTIPNSCNPDISIEILDRCLARKECRGVDITSGMVNEIVNYIKKSR